MLRARVSDSFVLEASWAAVVVVGWSEGARDGDDRRAPGGSGKTRNGSKWLDYALEEAALAAIRVKANYYAAQYQRLKPRRGHKKALGAVKHTMICAIWHMLSTGETHRDLGGDYFTNRDPRTPDQASRQTARTPRTPRHAGRSRGSLSELFLSGRARVTPPRPPR